MPLKGPDLELMNATKAGDHAVMKAVLIPGRSSPVFANVEAFDDENTPLSVAIKRKDYEAMRILLHAEADPNTNLESEDRYEQGDGATPLMFALSDPAAFAVILAHTRFNPDVGRKNWKGKASVDLIPVKLRSEIYSLLALYYGDEKQKAELRAIADAVGKNTKAKPAKKAPTKLAKPDAVAKRPLRYRLPTGETWTGFGRKPPAFEQWQEANPDQPFPKES